VVMSTIGPLEDPTAPATVTCGYWAPTGPQLGPNLIKHKTIDIDIDALLRACARSM